jgi:DNA repair exonuclease SbcCD nuclease subunit
MAKIILSADWHLKFSSQFDRTTDQGIPSRLQEIIESVDWVLSVGKKQKATYFLGLGDIFDSSEKLLTREGLSIKTMFNRISKQYTKTAMFLVGNHDQISSEHNILDLFSPIIKVFSSPSFVDIPGARLFFLPYLRESEDLYAALKEFESHDCPGKKYLFAHFWDTSVMGVDPEAIDLTKVNLDFFNRIFLGHYHVPSSNFNSKIIYIGTLLNKRFNETGPKGCWTLDVETNKLEFFANPGSPEFFVLQDTNVLTDAENLVTNAYYRIACDPENVLEVTKLLSKVKGFELVSKKDEETDPTKISIMNVEKRNSSSLKDYIMANCAMFMPEGVTEDEFKAQGTAFLANL